MGFTGRFFVLLNGFCAPSKLTAISAQDLRNDSGLRVNSVHAQPGKGSLLLQQIHARIRRLTAKPRSDGTHVHLGQYQPYHAIKHGGCIANPQGLPDEEVW